MLRTDTILLRKRRNERLSETLDVLRLLYNAALEQRILAYRRQHKPLSFYDQCKDLTELRANDERFSSLDSTMTRMTVRCCPNLKGGVLF